MSRFVTLRLVLALGMAGALSSGYFLLGAQHASPRLSIERTKEDLFADRGDVGVLVTRDGLQGRTAMPV